MYCKNCGSQNTDGIKFCRVCGAPLEQTAASAAPANSYAPAATPAGGYNPAGSYSPVGGYQTSAAKKNGILGYIPVIGALLAIVGVFLDWVTMSAFGVSDGVSMFTQLKEFFEFISQLEGDSMIMMIMACVALVSAVAVIALGLMRKDTIVLAIVGAISAVVFEIMYIGFTKDIMGGTGYSDLLDISMGIGFFLYIIGMVAAGVCGFLSKKK